ncbi:MAG: beta-N-acetylhexosaminidase, partial [Bacteroidales bacterium]|nr:beta-N-acetylhexosaminidase [Bacteroidales bacterium]
MIKLLALIAALVPQLIPAPAHMQVQDGCFILSEKTQKNMVFKLDPKCGLPEEGYTLEVTPRRIKAVASTEAGLFYARQTLSQLEQDGSFPCVRIEDYPRFRWRGFMVDAARHFMSVDEIKKHIDILSQYKINVMHWHLTDDQGWRIEIKKYPLLTQVGATRTEFDGTVTKGYYTQEEVKEVVAYAAEHFITVVPEIEMPGHSMAAIRSIPELSCDKLPVKNFYTWGSPDIVLCPGSEFTFQFLEDVVAEVAPLFPGQYMHIGGDECKKVRWEKCPACQARIAAEGLKADDAGTAEEKLQSYAVKRMEGILAKYGKSLVGWDEILEGGLSPNATVMSWRG